MTENPAKPRFSHMEHDAGIDTISMPPNTCPSTLRHSFFSGQLFGQLFGHAGREALKERYRPKWFNGLLQMVSTRLLRPFEFQIIAEISLDLVVNGVRRLRAELVLHPQGDFVNARPWMSFNEFENA